jgi:hypothetical protein
MKTFDRSQKVYYHDLFESCCILCFNQRTYLSSLILHDMSICIVIWSIQYAYHVNNNVYHNNRQGRPLNSKPLDGSVGTSAFGGRRSTHHDVGKRVDDELASSSKMFD